MCSEKTPEEHLNEHIHEEYFSKDACEEAYSEIDVSMIKKLKEYATEIPSQFEKLMTIINR